MSIRLGRKELRMENITLSLRESNSSDIKAREYSFAKEIRCSFWDSMTSQEIDNESLDILEEVLEFIEHDY